MTLALALILLCGTGNFAMHRWMLESGHPAVEQATGAFRRALGQHATYGLELVLLLGAATLSTRFPNGALVLYGTYTALNAGTVAWLKGPVD